MNIKVSDLSYNIQKQRRSGISQLRYKRNVSPLMIEEPNGKKTHFQMMNNDGSGGGPLNNDPGN
jgi:hypothetical protein